QDALLVGQLRRPLPPSAPSSVRAVRRRQGARPDMASRVRARPREELLCAPVGARSQEASTPMSDVPYVGWTNDEDLTRLPDVVIAPRLRHVMAEFDRLAVAETAGLAREAITEYGKALKGVHVDFQNHEQRVVAAEAPPRTLALPWAVRR